MRPLRLELEGFGPYRERQAVDFSDVELFAITGPTGSGKSTLLDAIAFALYGQVPRVGRQVGTLKHPAAAKAWVSLTFRVGERVYRVERSRSEKRGDARVYLLEGGERLLDLPTLEAVNRALADLVGLDYEAFTRALLLPQGEFDRFLKGEPKERRQLLLELFELSRLERARQKAAERRGLLLEEKGRLEGELNGLSAATPEALEELERALAASRAEAARLEEEARGVRKALAEAEAATRGLMPEAEAQGLALSPGEREALRAELEAFRKDIAEAEAAWRSLPPLSGPAPTLEEAQGRVEALRKALAELEGRLEEKRKEEGALEDRVERLRKDLARRREVEGALARLVAELALWEKLALDLQAHNFPAYLLGLKQRSLVERASELLYTLSGGRYRFAAQGDEYLVVDLWAEATARQVRTLSGGESFLASLALALALSEELSRGKLEALFLDEGFGTLDPEALELVAGILESLPTRGRLVGVVTHVEALAERFPARLRVRKHPWGSRVEWA